MKHSITIASLLIFAGSASAADLPGRHQAPFFSTPAVTRTSYLWTGFYVGAHAGYAFNSAKANATVQNVAYSAKDSSENFKGGLHAGYNWQTGSVVLGVEASADYGNARSSAQMATVMAASKARLQGSLRGRIGYAFDRLLIYGAGGVALTSSKYTGTLALATESHSSTLVGWTVGAGAEYAFTDAISARLEYRYTDFGKKSVTFTSFAATPLVVGSRTREQAVLAGVSFKF